MLKSLIVCTMFLGVLLTSCGKEDSCIVSDVVGTYSGTMECNEMNAEPATFLVVAGNSDIQIIIDGITTVIEDCDIYGSDIIQGSGREIDGDINGNKIHFVETIKVNGEVTNRCLWDGVKN